jgi:hypothetical protein
MTTRDKRGGCWAKDKTRIVQKNSLGYIFSSREQQAGDSLNDACRTTLWQRCISGNVRNKHSDKPTCFPGLLRGAMCPLTVSIRRVRRQRKTQAREEGAHHGGHKISRIWCCLPTIGHSILLHGDLQQLIISNERRRTTNTCFYFHVVVLALHHRTSTKNE